MFEVIAWEDRTVDQRQPFAAVGFALLLLFAAVGADGARAQARWPPWQSYGEAEQAQRAKPKRTAVPRRRVPTSPSFASASSVL